MYPDSKSAYVGPIPSKKHFLSDAFLVYVVSVGMVLREEILVTSLCHFYFFFFFKELEMSRYLFLKYVK